MTNLNPIVEAFEKTLEIIAMSCSFPQYSKIKTKIDMEQIDKDCNDYQLESWFNYLRMSRLELLTRDWDLPLDLIIMYLSMIVDIGAL